MNTESFRLALAVESLKIFRRVADRRMAAVIGEMEHAVGVLEVLPADERQAVGERCVEAAEGLLSAVRMLASVELPHDVTAPPLDPFELGAIGYG